MNTDENINRSKIIKVILICGTLFLVIVFFQIFQISEPVEMLQHRFENGSILTILYVNKSLWQRSDGTSNLEYTIKTQKETYDGIVSNKCSGFLEAKFKIIDINSRSVTIFHPESVSKWYFEMNGTAKKI